MAIKDNIKVMEAFIDGADIECRYKDLDNYNPVDRDWVTTPKPSWNFEQYDYRIKEGPTVFWISFTNDGKPDEIHTNRKDAEQDFIMYGIGYAKFVQDGELHIFPEGNFDV